MRMGLLLSEAAVVFLISASLCMLVGRVAVRLLSRTQCMQPDRYEDCAPLLAYQQTKPRVPTMGGVFVLGVGILVAITAGALEHSSGWGILGSILGLAAVGFWDDWLKCRSRKGTGLGAFPKLLIALGIGGFLAVAMGSGRVVQGGFSKLEIPVINQSIELGWLSIPFAMCVMAGCAHAVNLTDGMDGLAAGCMAIAFSAFGLLLLRDPSQGPAMVFWCVSLAGACVGFLWFNGFPGSVFLGDVGALGLGAALAALSLLSHKALWLLVIGGVFVLEALSVMLQVASYKWRGKRRIFRVAPLHHHFHLGGLSEPKVVMRFWIMGLLLAAAGLVVG